MRADRVGGAGRRAAARLSRGVASTGRAARVARFALAPHCSDPLPSSGPAPPGQNYSQGGRVLLVTATARQIDPSAHIHPTAVLGPGASVGPFVVVGAATTVGANATLHAGVVVGRGCRLGADVTLHPQAVLYDGCVLGDRVTVHAGAVVGADGFGYRFRGGRHVKVPQLGWVEVGDDVEVGAGTTIDRGTFGPTRIGPGTKIDDLVQVAHNCQIGRHNTLAGQVGIAGSTTTGDGVAVGAQAGIGDHLHVADGAVVAPQSGVTKGIAAGVRVLGFPARPAARALRRYAALGRLPRLWADVRRIKALLGLDARTAAEDTDHHPPETVP